MGSKIIILCDCIPLHDWMSFASWYSIKKKLPEYEVILEISSKCQFFAWARRLGVRISNSEEGRKIPCTVFAIRDFDGDFTIVSSKSANQKTFVNCVEGCGNFVVDEWINKTMAPFNQALKRFGTGSLTVNEMGILSLWEQCHSVYLYAGGP